MCPACLTAAALVAMGTTTMCGMTLYAALKIPLKKAPTSTSQNEGESHE